jgi:hypothetical protein
MSEEITRAHGRASPAAELAPISIVHVRVPPGSVDRRSPVAVVDAWVGPVRLSFTISSLKGNQLQVRPPMTAGEAEPGVKMPPALAARVVEAVIAAAKADPEAAYALSRGNAPAPRRGKVGGHAPKAAPPEPEA